MGIEIIKNKERGFDRKSLEKYEQGAVKKLFDMDKKELMTVIEDEDYWKMMKQLRRDAELTNSGFSKNRGLRHVARIPAKMYHAALELYGEEVFTDKNKFKKVFTRDEIGQWTLVVPKNTI